jgi:hypothetical protein
MAQLYHSEGPRDALHLMRAPIDQPRIRRQPADDHLLRRRRQYSLSSVRQVAQTSGLVDGRPDVVRFTTQSHLTCMYTDAHPDRCQRRPLQIQCARHRVAGMGERNHETVAFTLLNRPHAVMGGDDL